MRSSSHDHMIVGMRGRLKSKLYDVIHGRSLTKINLVTRRQNDPVVKTIVSIGTRRQSVTAANCVRRQYHRASNCRGPWYGPWFQFRKSCRASNFIVLCHMLQTVVGVVSNIK